MKKLKKFIEQTIKKKSKTVTMPTQEQLEAISRLSFDKPFYWSLFVELYLWNEDWDAIGYEYFENILENKGEDGLLYSLAMTFLYGHDYPMVIQTLKKYLKKYPNILNANYNIAQAYYENGETKKAIQYYEKSLDIDLSHVDSYLALAKIYKQNKEYDKALKYYKIALNFTLSTEQFYDVMLKMGDIYRDTEKNREGIACYKKAIKINNERDDKPRNYYLYIKIAYLSSRKKKRIKYSKKAIQVRPKQYEAYHNLGIYYLSKKPKKAIKLFKKTLKLNANNAQAHLYMGVANGKLDRDKKALKCYRKALSMDSSLFKAYINIFSIYEDNHKYPPKDIERMFIENFKDNINAYVMYVAMRYLVDIYHGKEIDLRVFEKEYKDAGMECCFFKGKKILKSTRKKDKKRVSELLEAIKKHTKIVVK